ncbi:MAG: FAD-binding oxidoreductase [Deltaproteobacteria bacterium]|nr:MAG: FAD-binding oxidoreductase [Deltaproteobacteria bacterium]
MKFNPLSQSHLEYLQSLVVPDRFSTGESHLDLHSKDQSRHLPCRPEAVIWPTDRTEVSAILKYANDNLIPVTGWGSGSSLEGNPIPVKQGLVIDFSLMNKILDIRAESFQVDVEPGVIYQDLNEKLKYTGLFFPPDPGARATIGGVIANNASGTRTVYYGSTKDYVLRLTVVLASGEIIETGTRAAKSSSGYDLIHIFVGSEGTLGLVVAATLRLVGLPEEFSAAVVTFPSVETASTAVYQVMRAGLAPAALELLGPECVELINREESLSLAVLPTLFMEFHGPTQNQLTDVLELAREICQEEGCGEFRSGIGRRERDRIFKARHELGEMIGRNHPGCDILIIDVATPITAYPEMIATAKEELISTGLTGYTFSHAGDGNIHLNLIGKKGDKKDWDMIEKISHRMVTKTLDMGGTCTGEHGVGIGKRKFMHAEHGSSLEWMKRIKSLFDPNGILNPGKIFP